ncbi:MAG: ACT domain-containing protein [Candidatus Thorarchaeota archaeon]
MTGIRDLDELLKKMDPKLKPGPVVFCTVYEGCEVPYKMSPIMTFREKEETTLILEQKDADVLGLAYDGLWSMITLQVHSSLEAVGFIAAISAKLAEAEISTNIVSAYYHDHLFVPYDRSDEAFAILKRISNP